MEQWQKVRFYPKVLNRRWKDHPHYGELCTLIRKDRTHPIWYVSFADGSKWYANERELEENG